MKSNHFRIRLSQGPPDPRFVGIARIITKGPPLEWLVIGLQSLSDFIASEPTSAEAHQQGTEMIAQMHDAADTLINGLQLFQRMPSMTFVSEEDVRIAFDVLPRIKEALALQTYRAPNRPPNIQRQSCAAVVVEAWRLVRPKLQPRSLKLYAACDEYWQVCSGEVRGSANYWREDVERALAVPQVWIEKFLVELRDRAKVAAN